MKRYLVELNENDLQIIANGGEIVCEFDDEDGDLECEVAVKKEKF